MMSMFRPQLRLPGAATPGPSVVESIFPINFNPNSCCCLRPKANVFCRSCGHMMLNCRVSHVCPLHPSIYYLMDTSQCHKCRAPAHMLQEMFMGDKTEYEEKTKIEPQKENKAKGGKKSPNLSMVRIAAKFDFNNN